MSKNLGIAYAIKSKNKKKMAEGGKVTTSAASESRPMPSTTGADAHSVSRNSTKKSLQDAQWTDQPTVRQAQRPSKTPLARPKLVGSDAFSVRYSDEIDQDLHRPMSESPDGYGKQPKKAYDEMGADRQGPSTPSLKMKMMAEGGMADDEEMQEPRTEAATEASRLDTGYGRVILKAEGGMIDDEELPQPEADEEEHASIAAAIMARNARKMAEGGYVDIEDNAQEEASDAADEYTEAAMKENYDSDLMDVSQPMDSNEHGDELSDEDDHGMTKIQKIMRRSAKRSPITK